MVKEILGKLLKKEEAAPDELPSLTEEIISKQPLGPPSELPGLEEPAAIATLPSMPSSKLQGEDPLLAAFKTIEPPSSSMQSTPSAQPPLHDEHHFETVFPGLKAQNESQSFFSNISEVIRNPSAIDKIVHEDLLARMKENWDAKKSSISGQEPMPMDMLETEISKRLNELKSLENKWRTQKVIIDEEFKILKEREKELAAKIVLFKQFLVKTKLYKQVTSQNYLVLDNCLVIKSLKDLIDVTKVADEKILKKHITKEKNELAEFAAQIDPKLALLLKGAKSKRQIVSVLASYEKKHVNP